MKRLLVGALSLVLGAVTLTAQSLEDLNIQIHGYATQGFLYSTQNNIFTTNSTDGSPAWTEAVLNVGAQPIPKLRVSVQARYFLLGNFGNAITLDFASADYKANDKFGVRFGKVKTPSGLFNEIQDIDPGYIWALLPQSLYPLTSRNSQLAHYGGVVYGTLNLGTNLGKLEYRGWGGERSYPSDDGVLLSSREAGIVFPNGFSGPIFGGALHWKTPVSGLMVGASDLKQPNWNNTQLTDTIPGYGTFSGIDNSHANNVPSFFARYEKKKVMVAGEDSRYASKGSLSVPGLFSETYRNDQRRWYAMASYKLSDKLTAGVYDSQYVDHQAVLGLARYSKDWAISGRYDFSQFLYAKAEQHIIDGTALGFDTDMNLGGLKPTSKLTILKIGVSF
jgi:hypothetical protein